MEYLGLKEVKEGIKEKGWHYSLTDKSGRASLNLVDNYVKAVQAHTENDIQVTLEEVREKEPMIYDHQAAINRIFGFGRATPEEGDKILQSQKPVFSGVAPMGGQGKDHKEGWDNTLGPPVRPVVNGNIGANAAIGGTMHV